MKIVPLNPKHNKLNFDCGDAELNAWLQKTANQHKTKGISSTHVAVPTEDSDVLLGYYAISVTEIINSDLPPAVAKKLPLKLPAYRLGRLATSLSYRGQRLGEYLLFDAIDRVTRVASEVGGICLIVNAKHNAIKFYENYGFEQMAEHPQNLFLLL